MATSASPRFSRSRRRSRWSIQSMDLLVAAAFFAGALLLLGIRVKQVDEWAGPTGPLSTLTVRQMRCQDSCSAVIFSTEEETPSALHPSASTTALAASAVSALLQGPTRQEDEPGLNIASPKMTLDRTGSQQTPPRNRAPDRLPPLIEKLVGSIDPSMDKYNPSSSQKKSDVLAVKTSKKGGANSMKHGEQQLGAPEADSVAAIAAAAAAATIFSHQDRYRRGATYGRLRMKSYNDQWEIALRWIASWDDATLESLSSRIPTHTTNTDRQTTSKKSSSSSPRRKKKIKPSPHLVSSDTHIAGYHNRSRSDLLYDTCVQKCVRHGAGSSSPPIQVSSSNKVERVKIQGGQVLNRMHTMTLGYFQWDVVRVLSPFYVDGRLTVFGGVLGMIVSSTVLWSIVNAVSGRKLYRTTSTILVQVLEDESFNSTHAQGESGTTRPNKKHSNKKAKRKKAGIKDARSKLHMPVVGSPDLRHSVILSPQSGVDEDESVESDDSYDLSRLRESRLPIKHVSRASVDDVSFARVRTSSCGQTGSITSNSTEDADSQIMASCASDLLKECIDDKSQGVPAKAASLSSASHGTYLSASNGSVSVSSERSSSVLHVASVKNLSSQAGSLGHSGLKTHKVEPNRQPLLVPTEEQREEAARNLREFQSMQIKKIMQLKEEKRIQEQLKKTHASPVVTAMNEIHRAHPQEVKMAEISLPRSGGSMTDNTVGNRMDAFKVQYGKVSEDGDRDMLLDELSRESFLLSSILDEDEEGSCKGDKGSVSYNTINSPSSMKLPLFQQVNVSDSSNESHDSFTLKLSAASFSPTWSQGDNKEQGIW